MILRPGAEFVLRGVRYRITALTCSRVSYRSQGGTAESETRGVFDSWMRSGMVLMIG